MIGVSAIRMWLLSGTSWLDRGEREVLAYLIEENRVLRQQVGGRRLRLTDDDRRKLAARAYRLGGQTLRGVATIVTPDTLLRWPLCSSWPMSECKVHSPTQKIMYGFTSEEWCRVAAKFRNPCD